MMTNDTDNGMDYGPLEPDPPEEDLWRGIHKLTEEMGELLQVIGKANVFPDGNHPDGGPPLRQRFEEELDDVQAAIIYFRRRNSLEHVEGRVADKLAKFNKWGLSGVVDR